MQVDALEQLQTSMVLIGLMKYMKLFRSQSKQDGMKLFHS